MIMRPVTAFYMALVLLFRGFPGGSSLSLLANLVIISIWTMNMKYGDAENRMWSYFPIIASVCLFSQLQVSCRQLLYFPFTPLCPAQCRIEDKCSVLLIRPLLKPRILVHNAKKTFFPRPSDACFILRMAAIPVFPYCYYYI